MNVLKRKINLTLNVAEEVISCMRLAKAMNRIAALAISTILLTQIASYSYGDIPSQIEWEEPLKGDPDWKVTGRNSTGNQTGNNSTTPQITIEMGLSLIHI